MTEYFLDTSIIIGYLRDKKDVVKFINEMDGKLSSSLICLAELYEGVYHSPTPKKPKMAITQFFNGLNTVYELDIPTVQKFGEIRTFLRKKGKTIDDMDIFIASTCLVNSITLITNNHKHFRRVPELKIHEYRY